MGRPSPRESQSRVAVAAHTRWYSRWDYDMGDFRAGRGDVFHDFRPARRVGRFHSMEIEFAHCLCDQPHRYRWMWFFANGGLIWGASFPCSTTRNGERRSCATRTVTAVCIAWVFTSSEKQGSSWTEKLVSCAVVHFGDIPAQLCIARVVGYDETLFVRKTIASLTARTGTSRKNPGIG